MPATQYNNVLKLFNYSMKVFYNSLNRLSRRTIKRIVENQRNIAIGVINKKILNTGWLVQILLT